MITSVLFGLGGKITPTTPTMKEMITYPTTAPSAIAMIIASRCYPICGNLSIHEIKAKGGE